MYLLRKLCCFCIFFVCLLVIVYIKVYFCVSAHLMLCLCCEKLMFSWCFPSCFQITSSSSSSLQFSCKTTVICNICQQTVRNLYPFNNTWIHPSKLMLHPFIYSMLCLPLRDDQPTTEKTFTDRQFCISKISLCSYNLEKSQNNEIFICRFNQDGAFRFRMPYIFLYRQRSIHVISDIQCKSWFNLVSECSFST